MLEYDGQHLHLVLDDQIINFLLNVVPCVIKQGLVIIEGYFCQAFLFALDTDQAELTFP